MSGAPAYRGDAGLLVLVLAAGAGTRFGGDKQMAPVGGRPMLTRVLEELNGLGAKRVVVLGASAERFSPLVPADEWEVTRAERWSDGPGASLRAGLATAPEATAALVVLGDLAFLRREAAEKVLTAADASGLEAVRAYEGQRPGHPLLLRGRMLERARIAPNEGLATLLAGSEVAAVQCRGLGVAQDVDRPADLDAQPPI